MGEKPLNSKDLKLQTEDVQSNLSFSSLGLNDTLCMNCETLNWKKPMPIQEAIIPKYLEGKNLVGIAETGSGKTGAYVLPLLQMYLKEPKEGFAVILVPSRELAAQVAEQIDILGKGFNIKSIVVIGKVDLVKQKLGMLESHFIVATPGRLLEVLPSFRTIFSNTKHLVLDESDRMLGMNFKDNIIKIAKSLHTDKQCLLLSATMTRKVEELQKQLFKDPQKIQISSSLQVPATLEQYYAKVPIRYKEMYLISIINSLRNKKIIVFCNSQAKSFRWAYILQAAGLQALPLNGKMDQDIRTAVIDRFKQVPYWIVVGTDLMSRGLDIPSVDVVINAELPRYPKEYVHRVGRTARAGKSGMAITFVDEEDEVDHYLQIETLVGCKFKEHEVLSLKKLKNKYSDIYDEAKIATRQKMKRVRELLDDKNGRFNFSVDDEDEGALRLMNKAKRKK